MSENPEMKTLMGWTELPGSSRERKNPQDTCLNQWIVQVRYGGRWETRVAIKKFKNGAIVTWSCAKNFQQAEAQYETVLWMPRQWREYRQIVKMTREEIEKRLGMHPETLEVTQ